MTQIVAVQSLFFISSMYMMQQNLLAQQSHSNAAQEGKRRRANWIRPKFTNEGSKNILVNQLEEKALVT